jgi:hypothetical protein
VWELSEPILDLEVSPTSGGLDARDQALMAYLSGATGGGAVMPDGLRCFDVAKINFFWSQPLPTGGAESGGSAVDGTGAVSVDCLTFPRGATLCNAADGIVQIAVPSGTFSFDSTGITLPGGGRIDATTG